VLCITGLELRAWDQLARQPLTVQLAIDRNEDFHTCDD
jgi:hypothetical protein